MRPVYDTSSFDPSFDCYEEGGSTPHSIPPTMSRRRSPVGEWDDYIMLYDDVALSIVRIVEEDDVEKDPSANLVACEYCEHRTPLTARDPLGKRGMAVHLRRRHGIKSERAEYFASRKEPDQS